MGKSQLLQSIETNYQQFTQARVALCLRCESVRPVWCGEACALDMGCSANQEPGNAGWRFRRGSRRGNAMPLLTALAISIGVLGGLATWVCLGMVTGLQIW